MRLRKFGWIINNDIYFEIYGIYPHMKVKFGALKVGDTSNRYTHDVKIFQQASGPGSPLTVVSASLPGDPAC